MDADAKPRLAVRKALVAAAAVAVIVVSAVAIVAELRTPDEPPEPLGLWVCDGCGREERAPARSISPDCPACAEGQMVQRVFFRCLRCGRVFEGCQVNWSPRSPRAAAERKQADGHKPLAAECGSDPLLLRRPAGAWQWGECQGQDDLLRSPECPECGKGRRDEFQRMLDPQSP